MKFRKKPVVIEAEQFWPPGDARYKPIEGVIWTDPQPSPGRDGQTAFVIPPRPVVNTLEGVMTVSAGDWIITGVNGERYPCKPDIFKKTYDPVEPEPTWESECNRLAREPSPEDER